MPPPPDRGACILGRLLAMSMALQIPAEAVLDNVVSLRRLASTSDGPNHRGPPLCTDLTHSLHRDGMARSWGERGRLFQVAGWLGGVLDDQPVIIEKITSVAVNAYSRALKRHIINEIEKSFAALTGGALAKIVCRMISKGRPPPQKLVSCMSSAYGAPHTAQFRTPVTMPARQRHRGAGDCND
jgi:hypothetical protein